MDTNEHQYWPAKQTQVIRYTVTLLQREAIERFTI